MHEHQGNPRTHPGNKVEPMQTVISTERGYEGLVEYLHKAGMKKVLVVCGNSCSRLNIGQFLDERISQRQMDAVYFRDFSPNPDYSSVVKGVDVFRKNGCDSILAIGGGSAMDTAKCIKLYATMPAGSDYIHQKIVPNTIPFVAVPTTAGTGSEATRFAVVYYNGEKQSVTDVSSIPQAVLFDPTVLESLPDYHRKSTMMDAFCHAVESFWSVNSTDESREYSRTAIRLILENRDSYLNNEPVGNRKMLEAANIAGKAINISQTTAGHAMCYKLTSLYKIAHGHAAALCVSALWPYMVAHMDQCVDPRGKNHLASIFSDLAAAMEAGTPESASSKFGDFLQALHFDRTKVHSVEDFAILRKSVNPVRLKNNPVKLDESAIDTLYHQILGE